MSAVIETPVIPTGTWSVDPVHSSIGFAVKHLGVSTFRGSFPGLQGVVTTADGYLVDAEGVVDIASLETSDSNLTTHLRSDDFFAVADHPTATFRSTAITAAEDGSVAVVGELTIRGVTLPVTLDGAIEGVGEDPYGSTRAGIGLTGTIDRTAYGIDWNNVLATGALAVANDVRLDLHIEATLEESA